MGIAPPFFNPGFAKSISFLAWMYRHEFVMYSLKPQEVNSNLTLFLPFGPVVWLSIAMTVICLTILLMISGERTEIAYIDFKGKKGKTIYFL